MNKQIYQHLAFATKTGGMLREKIKRQYPQWCTTLIHTGITITYGVNSKDSNDFGVRQVADKILINALWHIGVMDDPISRWPTRYGWDRQLPYPKEYWVLDNWLNQIFYAP